MAWAERIPVGIPSGGQPRRAAAGPPYAVLIVAAIVGLALYFWRLSLTVPPPTNLSDYANNLLYGQSLLNGNLLLRGWVALQDPMWFGDILYAVGLTLRGVDPALLHLVPVAVSVCLVVFAAWTSVTMLQVSLRERIVIMAVAVLPLVLPSPALASQVLVGPNHTDTTAAAFAAILALAPNAGVRHGRRRVVFAILGGTLLALGMFGDPYMLALAIVPIIGFAVYGAIVRRSPFPTTDRFLPMVAAIAAWGAAKAGVWIVPRLGGFTMRQSVSALIPLDQLGSAVLRFIRAYLELSGANFFGLPVDRQLLIAGVRLGYLCAAGWAVFAVLNDLRRGVETDWVKGVLSLGVLVAGVGTSLYPGASYAYQVPVFLVMGVVLARHLATSHRGWITKFTQSRSIAAALLVCGLFAALPIEQFQSPQGFDDPSRYPQLGLAQWLEQHGLREGYGPYGWASIITVETRGRVTVRALISTQRYQYYSLPPWKLVPNMELMGNAAWYTMGRPAFFLIVDNEEIDRQTAVQTFGAPDDTYRLAGIEVLAYRNGIVCTVPQSAQASAEEAAGVPPRASNCARNPQSSHVKAVPVSR